MKIIIADVSHNKFFFLNDTQKNKTEMKIFTKKAAELKMFRGTLERTFLRQLKS